MIDSTRWYKLSLAHQLGNVGSELSRAKHWQERDDKDSERQALERALELIDLMLQDKRWPTRYREIARLREVIGDWYTNQHTFRTTPEEIERYCIALSLVRR